MNNWAQTRMAGELWKTLLEEASHIFFFPIQVSKCTLKAKTKDDHSLKSDHYTITPTGPVEPLIKILTLQNSSEAKHSTAQHDTASWGLNIDTITTQEEYLAAAAKSTNIVTLCVTRYTMCQSIAGGYRKCVSPVLWDWGEFTQRKTATTCATLKLARR